MRDAERQRRFLMAVLGAAILLAPLLALLLRLEAGLLAMAVALAAVTMILHEARADAPERHQWLLRLLIWINLALVAACLIALVWMIVRG